MNLIPKPKKIVTIGTFDGVHYGHQKIIQSVIALSKKEGYDAVVLTLFPHPRLVLQNDSSIKLLHTIDERISTLKALGIKEVVVKPFTKAFANLSAEAYVKSILIDELNTECVVIGYDHYFGKNRSANITDLKAFAKTYDFRVKEISAQEVEDVAVSSTKIRAALHQGDIKTANNYLGYNYFITGTVITGKGLGRTIGFPTANISVEAAYKLIPLDGVYIVKSHVDNSLVYGMMNIGINPTVNGKTHSIEVHFFNFNKTIYNAELKIEFLKRLRSEQNFKTIDALKIQLQNDKRKALAYIKTINASIFI